MKIKSMYVWQKTVKGNEKSANWKVMNMWQEEDLYLQPRKSTYKSVRKWKTGGKEQTIQYKLTIHLVNIKMWKLKPQDSFFTYLELARAKENRSCT